MKKITKSLFFVLFCCLLLSGKTVKADDFDPNFIISDAELQNYQSMSRADIQAFLDNYPGILSKLTTTDKDGNQKQAADIIYQAACDYKINPKYILVKLQKEMGLITDATPTQRQLDYAAGYGCPDSGGCSNKNTGFGKQVDSAAGIMRWYYDNINTSPIVKRANQSYTIDGLFIKPVTFATAFLYTYTPHLQGNRNFWNLYQNWFAQIYPNGSLLKGENNPNVYLIRDNKKMPFADMISLVTRYDPNNIITVPDDELAKYQDGPTIKFSNYSILANNGIFYLLDNDVIRPFASRDVVTKMGYQPEEIVDANNDDLLAFTIGDRITNESVNPIGKVVMLKENKNYYFVKDGVYYPIVDKNLLKTNFSDFKPETVKAVDLANLKMGEIIKFRDGTLVGEKTFGKIYVIENGVKRHITNENIFNSLGYDWKNIVWVDLFTLENYDNGQPVYVRPDLNTTSTLDNIYEAEVTDNGKMITTPDSKTKYVGEKFSTPMDVYLVADYKTGKILAGKNIDTVRPLASFTKVMTAYELIKSGLNINKTSTFNEKTMKSAYHKFRIANGEKFKNEDLMKSMLISSVNTAAKILAMQFGTEQSFVKKMNVQVKSWGLKNTTFTDTYGYALSNKSTAKDYLTIFTKALGYSTVAKIMGMDHYNYTEVLDKDGKPVHFDDNSNLLVNKPDLEFNILESKTGYLDEAGFGLAMLVERPKDKKKFVIITMGNPDYAHRFDEPQRLTEWVLTNF